MISFWERESFLSYDYLVVGSGIVGLSTAVALKEKEANCSVLVLERGIFPSGASTKNAGFACIGSPTELLADLAEISETAVVDLVAKRYEGLVKLRERLGDKAIDYLELGSYELLEQQHLSCLSSLDYLNELLYPLLKGKAFSIAEKNALQNFGFNQAHFKAMICNHYEGQLDTGKMMRALLAYAQSLGVVILNGAEVIGIEESAHFVSARVKHHSLATEIVFKAQKLAICTNAFARQLLPQLSLKAGRGQVLVTHPIENLPFKGIFHFEEGYYYFRNYGNRIIFGGGRNLDFEGENTTEFAYNSRILEDLSQKLQTLILPNLSFTVDMQWTGIMGFGDNKVPILKRIGAYERMVVGVKLGGMGVAIGSSFGVEIADLLMGK